ncbi:membrane protein, partial [Mycobacterium avium subsp. paratuberculosis 10-5864]
MVAITVMALVAPVGRGGASVPLPQPVPGIASILPANGAVVGVAHPIVVTFTAPAADRAAVERSIHVVSPAGVRGHFEWADDNTVVRFVPNRYWPAHGHVSVGVQALTTGFDTGDALL